MKATATATPNRPPDDSAALHLPNQFSHLVGQTYHGFDGMVITVTSTRDCYPDMVRLSSPTVFGDWTADGAKVERLIQAEATTTARPTG